MAIESITVKQFRCFTQKAFSLAAPIILIKGKNGTGKTSLLEALYYAGLLRSFRTHMPKEMIRSESDAFSIKMTLATQNGTHELAVGLSNEKRSVKLDGKQVSSFKDLFDYVRMISMSEDDLMLIKGSPEHRRHFIDNALHTQDPQAAHILSKYRKVLASRNALLKQHTVSKELYAIWTNQLWTLSQHITTQRITLLEHLEQKTNMLVKEFIPDCPRISCTYYAKHEVTTVDDIMSKLFLQEIQAKRTLFGAHLDDIFISFNNLSSKTYASRGQQKLTILMLKIAQAKRIQEQKKTLSAFLLDDFMTDFDETRIEHILPALIALDTQLIFTCPTKESFLENTLKQYPYQVIDLNAAG